MSKDRRLQKIPKFPIDKIGTKSELANRGLKELKIIEDEEKCRYCGEPVDILDSTEVCSFCLDMDITEPFTPERDYAKGDFINNLLRQGGHDETHRILNYRITLDSSEITIGGILRFVLEDQPQRPVGIDDELYARSRIGSGMGEEYEGHRYIYKPFKKAEIEEDRFNAMLWKAKLFEDQKLFDNALKQYHKILEIVPDSEYVKNKVNALKS